MSDKEKRVLERLCQGDGLAFFGTVAASISHDMNNAVAIIEQTAGLLEDLLLDVEGGEPIDPKQVKEIAERIGRQTKRGAGVIRRLNAFAHSIDEPESDIELGELVDAVAALAARMAERNRISLEARPGEERLTIRNSSFRVQQALFLAVRMVVQVLPEGGKITLSTGRHDSAALISVESEGKAPAGELELSPLSTFMGQIGGEIGARIKNGRATVQLSFPN